MAVIRSLHQKSLMTDLGLLYKAKLVDELTSYLCLGSNTRVIRMIHIVV